MQDETEIRTKRRSLAFVMIWFSWVAGILTLYILSIGPVMLITDKLNISNPHPAAQFFTMFYKPVEWAYANTLLHKPIGLYYHLWIPRTIDSKGNIIH